MEKLNSAINWFEIPAINFDRAVRFYSEIYASGMSIGYFAIVIDTEGNRIYLHSMN